MNLFNLAVLDTVIVGVSILIFAVFKDRNVRTAALVLLVAIMKQTHGPLVPWLFLVFVLVAAPVGEIIIMRFKGTWRYASPDFLGIPIWLPPLWAIAAITLVILHKYICLNLN